MKRKVFLKSNSYIIIVEGEMDIVPDGKLVSDNLSEKEFNQLKQNTHLSYEMFNGKLRVKKPTKSNQSFNKEVSASSNL